MSGDYCCVAFVSLFINLRHPGDFKTQPSRRGTCYYYSMYQMDVFGNIFFSSGRGSFLVLSVAGHAGDPHGASAGPGRGPWHVL